MKNEYKITKDLIRSWAKEYNLHGAVNIFLFVFWCVLGVVGLSELILSIVFHLDWILITLSALILLVVVYKLFIQRFLFWSHRYKLFSTTYGVTEWMQTIEFSDDEIVLTDHTSVSKFKYGNVRSIKEKGNAVLIIMNHNMALRLYKDAFVEGSWEECKKMLLEKMKK